MPGSSACARGRNLFDGYPLPLIGSDRLELVLVVEGRILAFLDTDARNETQVVEISEIRLTLGCRLFAHVVRLDVAGQLQDAP